MNETGCRRRRPRATHREQRTRRRAREAHREMAGEERGEIQRRGTLVCRDTVSWLQICCNLPEAL